MPKQNRPLVRDGRLQVKKKRTDRSYLRTGAAASADEPALADDESLEAELPAAADAVESDDAAEETVAAPTAARDEPHAAFAPPAPATPTASMPAASVASTRTPSSRLPTAVRAIQQQGVRKRREFDVHALAVRDTAYAYHELRRIAVLSTMVIITLVVLWVVLR